MKIALLSLLIAVPAAQSPSGPTGGTPVTVPVPSGATSWSYETYDHDGWWNEDDLLEAEGPIPLPDGHKPGGKVEVDFKDLKCVDGVLVGPKGSTGEGTAEVYVVITFHFPGGATTTVETSSQKISCP
jgi:hypothetical protein